MDVLEDEEKKFDKKKSLKLIKIIVVIIILLIVAIIGIMVVIYYMKSKEFKVVVDGSVNSTLSTSDAFYIDGNDVYISLSDISKYLGNYQYNNGEYGEYKQYSEDKTSCYLRNDYEVVTFVKDSTIIYKKVLAETAADVKTTTTSTTSTSYKNDTTDTNTDYEYFTLDKPVIMRNNKLYASLQGVTIGCNAYISYDATKNTVNIYTLSKLVSLYTNKVSQAAIGDDTALFSNKKALLYDLVVVKDEKGKLGVVDTAGEEVIGEKYTSIKFIEGAQEFIVQTEEGKMGIISKDGTTKIKPEYDEIKQIDTSSDLYLVSSNKKYGVVNKNGKLVIYIEYDAIGIDSTKFTSDNIKNKYILYDNCIPVEKGEKWGLLDKQGNNIVEPKYDGLGCILGSSTTKSANNLLLIPEYEGIIVMQDKTYGLINSSGKELIPPAVTDFYSITSSGKNDYYLTYNKQTVDVLDYLKNTLGIEPVDKNTNTITNTITNSTNNTENTVGNSTVTNESVITNTTNNQQVSN